MLVVEDDVPAGPETVFASKKNTGPSSAAPAPSPNSLEILPYASPRDFSWWRDYQERQASASPLQDDHARAWVAAADALLSDREVMGRLRRWGPDVVVGDTAYLATYGLAAALGEEREEGEGEKKRKRENARPVVFDFFFFVSFLLTIDRHSNSSPSRSPRASRRAVPPQQPASMPPSRPLSSPPRSSWRAPS